LLNNGGTDVRFSFAGFILALTASAGVSLMNVSARRALSTGTELPIFMAKVFTRSALLISPFLFAQNPEWIATAKGATLVIWLGVIATALAYTLYATGLKHLAASTSATLLLAEPATATILAVTVLGNTVAPAGWVGIGFVLAGLIYLGARS
jgi:DME family drug/metabolite transporter